MANHLDEVHDVHGDVATAVSSSFVASVVKQRSWNEKHLRRTLEAPENYGFPPRIRWISSNSVERKTGPQAEENCLRLPGLSISGNIAASGLVQASKFLTADDH